MDGPSLCSCVSRLLLLAPGEFVELRTFRADLKICLALSKTCLVLRPDELRQISQPVLLLRERIARN